MGQEFAPLPKLGKATATQGNQAPAVNHERAKPALLDTSNIRVASSATSPVPHASPSQNIVAQSTNDSGVADFLSWQGLNSSTDSVSNALKSSPTSTGTTSTATAATSTAAAVTAWNFDFGPSKSPVAPGYIGFDTTSFASPPGYGWVNNAGLKTYDRHTSDPLTRDGVTGLDDVFGVNVANGTYLVTATLGDPKFSRTAQAVTAEGIQEASGINTTAGQFIQASFDIEVADGTLDLEFSGSSTAANPGFSLPALTAVQVANIPPTASAGANQTVNEGTPLTFSGSASGLSALTYSWNFGDGTTATGALNPTHTYTSDGSYTATLTVTDALGLTAQSSTTITVNNVAPTVNIGGPYSGSAGSAINFTASASVPDTGDILSYSWNFGDGSTSTSQNPTHAYASVGTYTVQLTVTDSEGLSSTAQTTAQVATSTIADPLLEDFSSLRYDGSGYALWAPYLGENPNQAGQIETASGDYRLDVNAPNSGSSYSYLHFYPYDNGYPWPNAYAQSFVRDGTFDPNCNRLSFWVKSSTNVTRRSDGGDILEIGTYIRQHNYSDPAWQGQHYYHQLDPNLYAGQWTLITLNRQPQHIVGGDSNVELPEDPEWVNPTGGAPVHYFDGLTRFYFNGLYTPSWVGSYWFKDFNFNTVSGEPDTLVSSITATYNGNGYELTWAGPPNVVQGYDIAYSTSSMKQSGFSSGTYAGSVQTTGNAYTGCIWQSQAMAQQPGIYFAIRPQGQSAFTEIYLPANPP